MAWKMTKSNKEKKSRASLVIGIITAALILLSVSILIFGSRAIKNGKSVKFFGYSFSVVVTGSMVPTINVDDVIIIKDYDFDEIDVGDIIVYYNSEEKLNVVHRVIEINADGSLTTQGDNNPLPDTITTTESNFVGKVVWYGKFLGIGTIVSEYRWAIFIAIGLIFIYILNSEVVSLTKEVAKKKEEAALKKNGESYEERKAKLREELLAEIKAEEDSKSNLKE